DGETQTTAWHDLYDDPEAYGLTYPELARVRVLAGCQVRLVGPPVRELGSAPQSWAGPLRSPA
ncbi:hypothetical protein ABZ768_27125, partial [Streptomyces griseoaurantiacus]